VRLGGTLVQNTTIDTANREFSIKNGEMSFVSGADPLGLTAEVGAPVPGMGFVSDGVSTNGLQSWIFSGKLPNSQGNQLLNVFGNFDLANNKQGGMVVQDLETNLYNSDQFNSSGINVRPTEIGMYTRGRINLTADHEFNLASNSGYLRFNNYYAGRNDTTTTPSYSLGLTERGTNYGSLGAANFYGGYTGASTETYRITIDIAPGSTWTVGSTRNDNNFGSPNNVIFGGAYSGSNFNDYYYLYIESGGTTFNWGDGSGNNGSGVPIVAGTPITLSQGVTVTFGSASYIANENWAAQIDYDGAPSTTFSWTDGSGGSGSGVTIPVGGGSVFLSQGVNVDFSSGIFISGEEWRMTIEERGVPAGANNFLYTDGSGFLRQAPTSLLGGGGAFSLTSQDEGSTLTAATNTFNFTGAGVTATDSGGGVVTVDIPSGSGDGNIYDNDGTLSSGRYVYLDTHTLNFQGGGFNVSGSSDTSTPLSLAGTNMTSNHEGVTIGGTNNASTAPALSLFGYNSGSGSDIEIYPFNQKLKILNLATDNTGDQVLAKDSLGNSVWRDVSSLGGGSPLQWYAENAAAPTNATIATGLRSITLNDGTSAIADSMFVYGTNAGDGATSAAYSNFLGNQAGYQATDAYSSNFLGSNAGSYANNAYYSNFLGNSAGYQATDASNSNFLGQYAGTYANNAFYSNFFGPFAGSNATDAFYSNFFGPFAGSNATNASNSIFIGSSAGSSDTVNNTTNSDNFSILIGPNTKTGGFSNSIALGGYATNTATNQLMIGSATRPIDTLVLTGSGGNTCVLDVTVASPSCSSDETLKTNITDLSTSTLENLLKVKTVSYNWKNYPDKGSQIGFLAQDLEQYFPEVVSVAPNGFKTVSYGGMTPILVEAMREMDLKITNITNPTEESSIVDKIIAKLIKADRVETKELCVDDVCVTRDQFLRMVESSGQTPTVTPPTTPDPTPNPPTCVEPQVLNEEGDACIDPVTETPSVETATPEPPPAEEPSVPTE
jgi:hypothetical protein